ncbi:hypothetical protein BDF20DRAFT_857277 [Mycotypha africana]|uniref:uncharacterized protein n=1 Tax=Mycotypha africana TaxID=64632 RepID=UPI0023014474|nr:uncharacterized protein BDF20DRAFT_857277 [Mycotypha africana]KAI8983975.1 hypothetical protein BDF20DRAFT_857277 [Mycotypha africana]
MNVARLANIPLPVIRAAKQKSKQVKEEMEQRQLRNRRIRLLRQLLKRRNGYSKDGFQREILDSI